MFIFFHVSIYIEQKEEECSKRMILNFQTGSGMEEAKPPPTSTNPQITTHNVPPSLTKKRPLDSNALQSSRYAKMRAVLKDLRPHFVEVLRTPEFRNCKAAHEIQAQMKFLMALYKQLTSETASIGEKPSGEEQKRVVVEDVRAAEQPQLSESSENKYSVAGNADGQVEGSYIVGGSAFGWNFITFASNAPVYYGITKEAFRTSQVKLWK